MEFPVEIADDVFGASGEVLSGIVRKVTGVDRPRVMLVADKNVVDYVDGLGTRIGKWVQDSGVEIAAAPLMIVGGEWVKSDELRSVADFSRTIAAARLRPCDCLLVLGGGTVLDLVGFSASIVRGGVNVIRIPTTPLAMFDAVYSTTASMNQRKVKDVLSVPAIPGAAVIDPLMSSTVLDGVWRAGFASALRSAIICDDELSKMLFAGATQYYRRDIGIVRDIVTAIVAMRKKHPRNDFALWVAGRMEAMSRYKLPHGYAISMALLLETQYSVLKGYMNVEERKAVCDALKQSGALDGILHSMYLFDDSNGILEGIDSWKLSAASTGFRCPIGIGGEVLEEIPDRDAMKCAINMIK